MLPSKLNLQNYIFEPSKLRTCAIIFAHAQYKLHICDVVALRPHIQSHPVEETLLSQNQKQKTTAPPKEKESDHKGEYGHTTNFTKIQYHTITRMIH